MTLSARRHDAHRSRLPSFPVFTGRLRQQKDSIARTEVPPAQQMQGSLTFSLRAP